MEDKEINPKESLAVIESMIHNAKNKLADDGFYFIFWGWLVTICALGHYFCLKAGIANGHWLWNIFMPLGGIVSIVYGWKEGKSKKVKTYVDTYITFVLGAFLIGMSITLILMPWNGYKHSYFFLIILYGILSFIIGGILHFKPLIFGSLFSFVFAILSVFLPDLDMLLCISGALLFSHIIPGHLLRSKYKTENV